MNRRTLLRLALLPPLLASSRARAQTPMPQTPMAQTPISQTPMPLSPQDSADLQRIQDYLNAVHTLQAHFLQVAPDGAMSQGTVWMERPGRMRFEYDPPAPFLLVAGGGLLTFEDKSIQQISQAPLSLTPLGILLADNVNLTGPVTVVGFNRLPAQLRVTLVRTSSPKDGTLTLLFTDTPLTLRQWTVLDAQRRETTVTLYNVQQGMSLAPSLFHFTDPRSFQPGSSGD